MNIPTISRDSSSPAMPRALHSGFALPGFKVVGYFEEVQIRSGSGDVSYGILSRLAGAVKLDWNSVPPSGTIEVGTGSAAGGIRNDFDDKDAKLALNFKSGSGDASVTRKP